MAQLLHVALALPAPDQSVRHEPQPEHEVPAEHGHPHNADEQNHAGTDGSACPDIGGAAAGELPQTLRRAGKGHRSGQDNLFGVKALGTVRLLRRATVPRVSLRLV